MKRDYDNKTCSYMILIVEECALNQLCVSGASQNLVPFLVPNAHAHAIHFCLIPQLPDRETPDDMLQCVAAAPVLRQ